jgi:hypothetical protein
MSDDVDWDGLASAVLAWSLLAFDLIGWAGLLLHRE